MDDSKAVEAVARALAIAHDVDPDSVQPSMRHVIKHNGVDTIMANFPGALWGLYSADAKAAIQAYLSHLNASGMCVVPREPTEKMQRIGAGKMWDVTREVIGLPQAEQVYRAMLSAHPQVTGS